MNKQLLGELEINRIYQRDCIDGMRMIPYKSVDLIIADPPYNKGVATWDRFTDEEYCKFIAECTSEFTRVMKPSSSLFIYNQQPYASYMFIEVLKKLNYADEIIWHYRNGGSGGKKLKNSHQLLYWFTNGEGYSKNLDAIRQPYSGTRAIYKTNVDKNPAKAWTPNEKGALPTNVWEISVVRQKESTPLTKLSVQKPLEISERIIKVASNAGDTILIPFVGSGSECVASIKQNRNFVGFETEREHIEIANKWIDSIKLN
jgi:site-specific DNA-methyltransferase (adenine-specific)